MVSAHTCHASPINGGVGTECNGRSACKRDCQEATLLSLSRSDKTGICNDDAFQLLQAMEYLQFVNLQELVIRPVITTRYTCRSLVIRG